MKRIKSRIPSICAAVLMVGCLCATTAFAAASAPLPRAEGSVIAEQIPAKYDGDNEVVVLSEVITSTDDTTCLLYTSPSPRD